MTENKNHVYISLIMFTILAVIVFLNIREENRLLSYEEKYEKNQQITEKSSKFKSMPMSSIINEIIDKKYIKVEGIENNIDENVINVKIKFTGKLDLLDDFINNVIKEKDSFYNINSLNLKSIGNNEYQGDLDVNFTYYS